MLFAERVYVTSILGRGAFTSWNLKRNRNITIMRLALVSSCGGYHNDLRLGISAKFDILISSDVGGKYIFYLASPKGLPDIHPF